MKNVSDKKFNIGAYILRPYARSEEHIRDIKNAHIDFMISMDCHKPTLDLFEKYDKTYRRSRQTAYDYRRYG